MAVQPRGYGEHSILVILDILVYGSTPWIRGTPVNYYRNTTNMRFNPVDTGNTQPFYLVFHFQPVQPRGYGEHG